MDSKTPEEISSSKEEDIKFKYFENPSDKVCSKVNWGGESSEKIIFVDPILDEEDHNHQNSCRGHDKAIEGNDKRKHDVERIHHCVVELWFLQGLVELYLE